MNRFFSKLNLQDIKINPEGHNFPPDDDEQDGPGQDDAQVTEAEVTEEPVANQYAPTRAVPAAPFVPAPAPAAPIDVQEEPEIASAAEYEPNVSQSTDTEIAPSNGHAVETLSATAEYVSGNGVVAVSGEVLKVSARSRPSAVAGAIAGVVREAGRAEVQAIGAGATNQAVKAVAIARDYLSETGIDAICVPAFIDVMIDNEDRTAIRLVVEPR